jgi:hypothetical protein
MIRRFFLCALVLLAPGMAFRSEAHEVRPGYLEIRETSAGQLSVLWRVPAREDMRLAIHPRFPGNCQTTGELVPFMSGDSYSERSAISCDGSLEGRTISIDGLSATMTDVLVRLVRENGSTQVVRLTPSSPSFVVEAAPGLRQVSATYLRLGTEHILLGIDHLLFVLALLILVRSGRRLVATVTAFTLAHSLTLAAATLGFVHVPQQPVEAVIALSIVFVACEIVRSRQGRPGITERWPWVVAFVFGLLHGFGFAGALSEVGLPDQAIPLALFFFNVGVEGGQLLFIAAVMALIAAARRVKVPWPEWAAQAPAYGIGAVSAYWMIERATGLW